MKTIRHLTAIIALAAPLATTPFFANAQEAPYPSRPITLFTPTAAGGGTDIVARLTAEKMAAVLGQPIVVTNKPGAGGVIGNQAFKREKADGYAVFVTANSNQLIVPWVVDDAGFDPIADFQPVAGLGVVPYVLAVHPSFPAHDLADFIARVKAAPGEYPYASAGVGTLNHLIPEMLAHAIGSKMEHIPYRGVSQAMTDVLGNQVPILFGSLSSVLENIRSGKLRALAVSSPTRLDLLPDVPAIAEQVPGFEAQMWVGLYALAGTPRPIVDRLYEAARTALEDPDTKTRFQQAGMTIMRAGPDELARLQQDEYRKWGETVRQAGANAR